MNGDCYLVAPEELVRQNYCERLARKHIHMPRDLVPIHGEGILQKLVSPGMWSHYMSFTCIQQEATMSGGEGGRCFIADLEHWPKAPGGTYGHSFPSQLTHGTIYSWGAQRIFLGAEHLLANGWHLWPSLGSAPPSPMSPMLLSLNDRQQKFVSGNGMSLPAVAAWVLYCLSNTVRVESPKLLEEAALWGDMHADRDGDDDDDCQLVGATINMANFSMCEEEFEGGRSAQDSGSDAGTSSASDSGMSFVDGNVEKVGLSDDASDYYTT